MKHNTASPTGVQELCRKLKIQLEELSVEKKPEIRRKPEDEVRRSKLMDQLKRQLAELSL